MAKKSVKNRNVKRKMIVKKFSKVREELVSIMKDQNVDINDKIETHFKLQKLPKNSAKVRVTSRCRVTGRPKGVYSKFGLCSSELRKRAMNGEIPGLVKSSW